MGSLETTAIVVFCWVILSSCIAIIYVHNRRLKILDSLETMYELHYGAVPVDLFQHCLQYLGVPPRFPLSAENGVIDSYIGHESLCSRLRTLILAHDPGYTKPGRVFLVKHYPTGNTFLEHHSDGFVNPKTDVIIFSFGATRTFEFKHKKTGLTKRIPFPQGSMFVMHNCDAEWTHSIIQEPHITQPRWSFIFIEDRP